MVSVKASFTEWVDAWLIPKLRSRGIDIHAIDLYAARCGVLHRLSVDSDLTEASKARRLLYYYGNADPQVLLKSKDAYPKYRDAIVIKLEMLWECLTEALQDFDVAIQSDSGLANRIIARKGQRYKTVADLCPSGR